MLHLNYQIIAVSRFKEDWLLKDAVFRVIIAVASAANDVVSGGFDDDADVYEDRW